ncbi:cytochrome P450 6k1 isoform X1 [Neodiprion lecontei]|uniref:Cytochrome P450 6k1 isoform X1 n=1 Tax=Neodiprion lecontei TaxID=441921 RepID=A0A6J0BNX8_NEOLC|nr:cytochrome P450 6k1 isoform X1 [Neodiprion lecontei]
MGILSLNWWLDFAVVFASAIVAAYLYMTRNFNHWSKRNVMEVSPIPFFGNFLDCCLFRKSTSEVIQSVYEKGSGNEGKPYVGFYVFDKPALVLRDHEIMKRILIKDFDYFRDRFMRTDASDTIAYGNLFLMRNPAWRAMRLKLSQFFSAAKLQRTFRLMVDVGEDLDRHLEALKLGGTGRTIEVKEIAAEFMTDLIGSCAFGLRVNCLNNPDAEFRTCGKNMFQFSYVRSAEFTSIFFIPELVRPLKLKFFSKASTNFMRKVFTETLNKRMESGVRRDDLIDLMIDWTKSDIDISEDFKLEGDSLVGTAALFLAAGFETTSTIMAFGLYELALHPDVQSKLREEIRTAMANNGGDITYRMINSLPYLDKVVSETLRKYPSLPFLDRMANTDYEVAETGLVIEKGTPVYVSLLGLHYDPEYYPEPHKFDPERFSEANRDKIPRYAYLPFGIGPRSCVGLRLGMLQSKLGILKVISNYELTVCEKTKISPRFNPKSLLLGVNGGLFVNARKVE